ncbi:cystatin-A1-like [Corythoichthys intestinalis]|uniref:cystatin-A1-like n=1 Tax=Corythoichthys intestinalis TaxID=161448 RepID=UPI0025A5E926|nr:cystatin-A1-like [Corythoichthys intestinalis]XP_061810193.1 cystatin-A1-like [Nerophis lumbriciformis]
MMQPGGLGDAQHVTVDIQKICDTMKSKAEQRTCKKYGVFVAKLYKVQVVAGTNYFIKVHVGGDDYVHICVLQTLPRQGQGPEFVSIKEHMKKDDEILPF